MESSLLNHNIVEALKGILPKDIHIVRFLMDTLHLGKEAIYRRLRNDVVFSFAEVYSIAKKLNVSLDYLIHSSSESNIVYELRHQQYYDLKEDDYNTFRQFERIIKYAAEDPLSRFEISHNLFPQLLAQIFYYLSKYNSFKWVYQNRNAYHVKPFKQIEHPLDLFLMHKKNNMETMKIKNTSYIWDSTIIETIVREIKYFKSINLLDNEDVGLLKKDLHDFLYLADDLAQEGKFETGNKLDIYISSTASDAAYSYIDSSSFKVSFIGVFDLHYMISTDIRAIEKAKEKISALKRVATLISGSGEVERITFFAKQHEWVDSL